MEITFLLCTEASLLSVCTEKEGGRWGKGKKGEVTKGQDERPLVGHGSYSSEPHPKLEIKLGSATV